MSESVTDAVRAHVSAHAGGPVESASVTFLGLEPVQVLRWVQDGRGDAPPVVHFASVGCSRHPMTDPTATVADPERGPRAEVVVRLYATTAMAGLHRTVATLAALPAVEGVVLGDDALVDLGEPLWEGAPFTAVILQDSDIPDLACDEPRAPVHFLEAVPITATEAAWKRLRGTAALREAWREAAVDLRDPHRAQARI